MPSVTDKSNPLIAKLDALAARLADLEHQLGGPAVVAAPQALQRLARERAAIADVVGEYAAYQALLEEIEHAERLAADPQADPGLRAMGGGEGRALWGAVCLG